MRFRILTTLLFVSLTSAHVQAGDKNPAATPSPRKSKDGKDADPNWMKRHDSFVAIAKKGNVDVLFLGDSITDAWGGEGHSPKAAGAKMFAKEFEPLKAANFGIGGDQTQHVLWRIQNGELDGIKPKVVMLMIGTNNTSAKHSTEQITEGVTAIVKTIHEKSPSTKILLLAVFPRANTKTDEMNTQIPAINQLIQKLEGKNVKYLDIGQKFLVNGKMSKDIMPDYLHLSARGYEIWAEAVAPVIKEMLK